MLSLALGASTVACTPTADTGHVASASDVGRSGAGDAAKLGERTRAALAAHQPEKAIRFAERAAAAAPADAGTRLLLGQAYLAAGRFASAETSFRDAASLSPANPRADLQLALAEIAQGKTADARAHLAALDGKVSDADLGLALALSGDRAHAIDMLAALVRAGKSDARSRQNLALALALDGRWREARGVAMQDVGPDRINDQIARWATLAASNDPRLQVAAVLGATPAGVDPGRPAMLALAPTLPAASQPAVALAVATPAASQPISAVPAAPIVDLAPPATQMAMLGLPAPTIAPVAAPAPIREAALTIPAIAERPAAVPVLLAAPKPRAQRSYVRVAVRKPVAPGPILAMPARAGWVVQLGAYSKSDALQVAWSKVSRLSPHLAGFTPVSGSTRASRGALVRLAVSGFAERRDASRLCEQIKARGGACFVRAAGNDTPWQWARRDATTRVAMAEAIRRG